jgi:O-antigen/teichoic acid export membrane protein
MSANKSALAPTGMSGVSDGKKEPRNRFILNTATILSAQVARAGTTLLLEIVYARLLGPSGRGQLSLCLMVLGCGVLVGSLGGEIPIMLWSADEKRKSSEWLPSVIFCGLLGSALASGLWALLFWWWHPAFIRGITGVLAWLLFGSIPFSIFGTYSLALLVGLDRLRERSVLVVSSQFATLLAAGTLLYVLHPTAELALVAVLIGLLVALLNAAFYLKSHLRRLTTEIAALSRVGAALSLGIRGQLGNVATFFNYRLDVFVVNYYLSTTEVGLYALGVMVSETLWQIPNAAAMALVPRTAREHDNSGSAFTCLVCRQVFAVACVTALVVAALSGFLVPLIFGDKFGPSVPVIWWILPGTIALAVSKVMCADLLGRGMPEYSAMFAFVTLLVTVGLDLFLIPRMGIQGAALASSVAYLTNSGLVAFVLKRKLGVTWKALYVPSRTEFTPYRQIWSRFVSRLRPTVAL